MQVDGGIFAAAVNFNLKFQTIPFLQTRKASAFNRTDVNKCIRLAIITLDETETLHCIEELHRSAGAFAGKLALRAATITTTAIRTVAAFRAWAIFNRQRLSVDLEVCCGNLAATIHKGEAQRLSFGKAGEASLFNRADVDKHVFAAIITNDEAETLLAIEEFYDAGAFANNLRGHSAAETAAAATAAATKAAAIAAKATPVTETTTITAETATITKATTKVTAMIREAAKIVAAEIVPFISAASAATSIKTHALLVTFTSPESKLSDDTCRTKDMQNPPLHYG